MELIKYGDSYKKPIVLCLGYFDAVHIGHTKIINSAKELAKNLGAEVAVLAFLGGKNGESDIFTFFERLIKFKALNVDALIYKALDCEFMAKTREEFLNEVFYYYNVLGVVVGEDFTYGKLAKGNVSHLKEFLNGKAELYICPQIKDGLGEKISSKTIKKALLSGDVNLANSMLGSNYFIRGEVVKGKGLGAQIGFPTANLLLEKGKLLIKEGVYLTCTVIGSKLYSCLTNVGTQPTVNGESTVIETYIHGYNGDLYGKQINVYFIEKIRDIVKFSSVLELKEQLTKDMEYLK